MRWRDVLRTVATPYGRGPSPPGDFCGPPPRSSVRPRERVVVKAGDACTSCGYPLEPIAKLQESVRVEGAAWWCARCGLQFREAGTQG
jgi:hypothetical protein